MQWIAVTDKNPDDFGEYLGSTKARPNGWVFKFSQVGWICSDDYPVTHWMQMPSPPHSPSATIKIQKASAIHIHA